MTLYFWIPPAVDTRPIEQRVCDTCGESWAVRVPSVGQDWTTCPKCQTVAMIHELNGGVLP